MQPREPVRLRITSDPDALPVVNHPSGPPAIVTADESYLVAGRWRFASIKARLVPPATPNALGQIVMPAAFDIQE